MRNRKEKSNAMVFLSIMAAILILLVSVHLLFAHQSLTAEESGERGASFIVQGSDMIIVSDLVKSVGGIVTHKLKIINAVGARLTPEQLHALEKLEGISRIYKNHSVDVMDYDRMIFENGDNLSGIS